MLRYFILLLIAFQVTMISYAQKKVSITIDDVPSYYSKNYKPVLLDRLDSLDIPATIFINERLVYANDSVVKRFGLLNEWIKHKNITLGNHTFSHLRYSEVGLKNFTEDVKKGESITKELAKKYDKKLDFFRFPYNDLGKDSIQQFQIDSTLLALGYINTPFTIESSDWMFNKVYTTFLEQKDFDRAKKIGELYVLKTLEYFDFFDSISSSDYGRDINHIYLCHDNRLNADYLATIISELENNGYKIVTLREALSDEFYEQKNEYYLKWGVSWFYRYMKSDEKRNRIMRSEPDMQEIQQMYNNLNSR